MYTERQRETIENFSDNILLFARAGAGKTFTVANKIAEGIKRGIKPEEILCLTFTVKAADEIKSAVEKICGEIDANISTIHGFCYKIVRNFAKQSGVFREPSVADEIDCGSVIKDCLKYFADKSDEYKISEDGSILPEKQLVKIVSELKHIRKEIGFGWFDEGGYGQAFKFASKNYHDFISLFSVRKFSVKITDYDLFEFLKVHADEFMKEYERILRSSDLFDYDDLIFCASSVLDRQDLKKSPYKLIIVDEMQDTSMAEYEVMRKLFNKAQVVMCGDEYQTIYAWRGSSPTEIIKDFKKNYSAVTITLDGNRRSSGTLVYAGNYYLYRAFGYKKPNDRPIEGDLPIEIAECGGDTDEAEVIFKELSEFNGEPDEICVMARSNSYLARLCQKLENINSRLPEEKRLGFFTADKDYQFYKKKIVKTFLAYLRLLVNPNDLPSFERVVLSSVFGVGRATLSAFRDYAVTGASLDCFLRKSAYEYGDNYQPLLNAYKDGKVVVYDLETTGLDVNKDDFIQISAIKIGKEGIKGQLNIFVVPTVPISAEAEKTHGYGLKEIIENGGVDVKKALTDFADFSKDCVLIGHNSASFDDVVLRRISKKEGIELSIVDNYDTLKIASDYRPDLKNRKLSTLCEEFGIVNERAHDAFSDVSATVGVLRRFIEEYIIPTKKAREGEILRHRDKFRDFFYNYEKLKNYVEIKDVKGLMVYIGKNMGVLDKAGDQERISANDLYRSLKFFFDGYEDGFCALREFVSATAMSGSQMDIMIKRLRKIPLITVHQSKGCEFDEVIIAGADENEFPSYGARLSGNEEEEKRVFYVALTRAKKKLVITYSAKKTFGQNSYERKPSPYLDYLPSDAVDNIKFYTEE